MAESLRGYQVRDHEVIDYHMTELDGTGMHFRGPVPESLEPGSYFAAIGAAQTFGCYCEHPFPEILADRIGLPALNLGWPGPGPEWFVRQTALLPFINNARFAVLQVMSGRSVDNTQYQSGGLAYVTRVRDGRQMSTDEFFDDLLAGPAVLRGLPLPLRVRRKLANLAARPAARRLVGELRQNWVRSSLELFDLIEVPVVLFWFSERTPAYAERYATTSQLMGRFPQLVTAEMVDQVRPRAAAYVECVSQRGMPQPLYSRFTGERFADQPFNHYYPSPQMQEDAADALEATCRRFAAA